VVEEFVEAGESGTSTKRRNALAELLERVTEGDIDYVIVHKVDRLARRRADDVAIAEAIRGSGARLVSVSENIDETPSGMLLHGIMASIAEFYSMNLGAETLKGTMEKARRGGTPGKAPIGYLNVRETVDGREVRTVRADPERKDLVQRCFQLYATGDYSLAELATILEAQGLKSRATARKPATALGKNDIAAMLANDYYVGVVRYSGIVSEGRHEKLVSEETFQAVQDLLQSRKQAAARTWRHSHYLAGSLLCADCGTRLMYTRATGGSDGTYEYFVCIGKGQRKCSQPHHRVEAVERAVEKHYARVELSHQERQTVRTALQEHVATRQAALDPERSQVAATLSELRQQERKLLQAHYQDQISSELFGEEQQRIRRERVAAERRQRELDVDHESILGQLDVVMELTDDIHAAYLLSEPAGRRILNQAVFEPFKVDSEQVVAIAASPLREVRELCRSASTPRQSRTAAAKEQTPSQVSLAGSSNVAKVVARPRLELGTPRFSVVCSTN
jgi:site-specific DNA recombinase